MKKNLALVAVIVLILVGGAAAYVINDPVSVKRMTGMLEEDEPVRASQTTRPATRPAERQVAQVDPAAGKTPDSAPPATEKSGRPPTREEFEKARNEEAPILEITRKARFVGPRDEAGTNEPPKAELYPFTVNRRTYPDASSITVELAIKNASGTHWRTAYITLRSPLLKKGQLFEIKEWKIDEVIGLDYTFPRGEVEDRMKGLRVISVSGDKRESALAERVQSDRMKALDSTGDVMARGNRAGDQLSAPGLLSLLGEFQSPMTGIEVSGTEMETAPEKRKIEIEIPEDALISETLNNPVRETSNERQEVSKLIRRFHDSALAVQASVHDFETIVESAPYRQAMAGDGQKSLENLRAALTDFNEAGRQLAMKVQRSSDAEVRRVTTMVKEYSEKILGQLAAVEGSVRGVDPGFRIQVAN